MTDGLPDRAPLSRPILDTDDIRRAIVRIGHEVVEREGTVDGLVLVGIQRRGVPLAHRIAAAIEVHEGVRPPVGELDITLCRDDLSLVADGPIVTRTDLPFDVTRGVVVLVDDVLFTGRTVRAAMSALAEYGRPRAIRLVALIDRGHREYPIRADHVGRNVPTARDEAIVVRMTEIDGEDAVLIEKPA